MQVFAFQPTSIEGLTKITPFCAPDERGYLSKTFERAIFQDHGIDLSPWEELRSYSHKGVLRGLHFQRSHCQDKLVQVLSGAVYDVAVDLRVGSPTFGRWEGFTLTADGQEMLYIPKGFAHGFLALEEGTLFNYLCGERYDPASDGGIRWNDPDLAVPWPLERVGQPVVSGKDQAFPTFAQFCKIYRALKQRN